MSGHRQAAAVLHGLAEPDRAMILAELPAADQAKLQDYLRELHELGFEQGVAAPTAVAVKAPAVASAQDALTRAPVAAMQAILAQEPASLVGQLLALGPWPWADALLAQWPTGRREQVRAAVKAGRPAPARARFLLEEIAHRLADVAPPVTAGWQSGLLQPLQRLVRQWTR